MNATTVLRLALRACRSLWNFVYLHRNARIRWSAPHHSKVVVFDVHDLIWRAMKEGDEDLQAAYVENHNLGS